MDSHCKPDFFLVGAPKCGTTALNDYLRRHPEIYIPNSKEFHFFGSDLKFQKPRNLNKEIYLSFFQNCGDAKRVGEASVMYLYSANAPKEIYDFNQDASIIIMVRNPIDVMYSHYSQKVFDLDEDIKDFAEALDAEGRRLAGNDIPEKTKMVDYLYYRKIVKFSEQVDRFYTTFGKDQVHVIVYDDFRSNPDQVYKEVLAFLKVDESFSTDFNTINANKTWHSKRYAELINSPPKILTVPFKRLIPLELRRRAVRKLRMMNAKYQPRDPMDQSLRETLKLEFREEIDRLGKLIERDLSIWHS